MKPHAARARSSITRETLIKMAIRIAIVIVTTTGIAYYHMVGNLQTQSLEQLAKYVGERGERERMIFSLAEDNHAVLKRNILSTLDALGDADPRAEFDRLFERHDDGITRNKDAAFDGTREAGVYISDDVSIDADIRRRVLTYYRACNRYGPAWHNRFQDTYITTPENIMVIYWPEVPRWCQDATTDLHMPDEEYVWVADKKHNPERETVWTGLFYDHVAKVWMVSCETPIDVGDRHIGTLGHDITLNELLDRTIENRLEGTYNLIFRKDGRLIVHPERMAEIQEQGGYFDIAESGDPHLNNIVEAVRNSQPGDVTIENGLDDEYLAVATIDEPGWYFVTVFPKEILAMQAMKTARFILILGVLSLLIEVTILFYVLRRHVALPLKGFVEATDRIANHDFSTAMDAARNDELGQLAQSFNVMTAAIQDRDKAVEANATELARHRDQLEEQVAERTAKLEAAMKQLDTAKSDAEAASQSKSEFLANMSHEIRTPMTAILGFTETMMDPDQSPEDKLGAIHIIRRNGDHLLQIINDILDLSKIEAGKLKVEHICCSPVEMVTEVYTLMQVRAEAKSLDFSAEFSGSVPEVIHSDPTRLKQILVNLIGNAIKFTETGAVRLVIRFIESESGPRMQFDVHDTGIGMTKEQMGRLFQAFSQADSSTTREFGGTGLGLSISLRLAEMLGGDIIVESESGTGSMFRVTIATGPIDGVKMLTDPTMATDLPETGEMNQPNDNTINCRILLAEDGRDNQKLITHILKKAGAEVTVVENGKLAVEAAWAARDTATPFDLIVMDMQMPVMDGYEAASLLRHKGYTGLIIALTAHSMANDRQKCLDSGCDDYETKPIDREKLIRTIASCLDRVSA